MEKCGITHYQHRLISNLSGGYQQRVGLAQAIIHDPLLVVLDEPTNGLDPNSIREVRKVIKALSAEHAVILSTHILPEVELTCDKVNMVERGKLVFSGTVEEFKNHVRPESLILEFAAVPEAVTFPSIAAVEEVIKLHEQKYRVKVTSGEEAAQKVMKMCIENGWGLKEAYLERYSLEEVFAQLSQKEGVAG